MSGQLVMSLFPAMAAVGRMECALGVWSGLLRHFKRGCGAWMALDGWMRTATLQALLTTTCL